MSRFDVSIDKLSEILCANPSDSSDERLEEAIATAKDMEDGRLTILLQMIAHSTAVERLVGLRRLLDSADRLMRNRLLTLGLHCDIPGWKNDLLEHISNVEAVSARRVLVSRDLEPVADDAIAFALTQLIKQDGIEHLRAWLIRVAMRQAIALKKRAAKVSAEIPEGHDESASLIEFSQQQNVEDVSDACDIVDQCRKDVLSAEEDQILDFHFFQERTGREIAELLSMPISTVYKRRENALAKLKRCLSHKRGGHDE